MRPDSWRCLHQNHAVCCGTHWMIEVPVLRFCLNLQNGQVRILLYMLNCSYSQLTSHAHKSPMYVKPLLCSTYRPGVRLALLGAQEAKQSGSQQLLIVCHCWFIYQQQHSAEMIVICSRTFNCTLQSLIVSAQTMSHWRLDFYFE